MREVAASVTASPAELEHIFSPHVLPADVLLSVVLPGELSFLLAHGLTLTQLESVYALSLEQNIAFEKVLFALELIEPDLYYRAVAQELEVPFLKDFTVSSLARYPESILAGLVPLHHATIRFIMAPQGDMLSRLLARKRSIKDKPSIAMTTPDLLREGVMMTKASLIAKQASYALVEALPHQSAKDGLYPSQRLSLMAILMLVMIALAFARTITFVVLGLMSSILFLGMIGLRLGALMQKPGMSTNALSLAQQDADLPIYTIIVPLYREKRVLSRLIKALKNIDYPKSKLDIKLVIEQDDLETAQALNEASLPFYFEIVTAPDGRPRTKPRALNVALPLARGKYVVVYDAEDIPDADQLRKAVASFERLPSSTMCLQAHLAIDNSQDSWLTRFFALEYAALFDVINPGLASLGQPVLLGGTSNHFRTRDLQALYGWDAWNVTEDADLGIRIAMQGGSVADLSSTTFEEAPRFLTSWMKQRARWMKGYMQVCITHSRHPLQALRDLGGQRFAGAVALTFGTVLTALMYPFCFFLSMFWAYQGTFWTYTSTGEQIGSGLAVCVFLGGFIAMIGPACLALSRRKLWHLMFFVPFLPFYYILVSIAAWWGLVELIVAPFQWNKTEHGLAKQGFAKTTASSTGLSRPVPVDDPD